MKYSFLIVLSLFSCHSDTKKTPKHEISAIIDNDTLYTNTLDNIIQNQLYENLFSIFYFREIALEEIMKEHLLKKEAKMNNITPKQLIEYKVDNILSKSDLHQFIKNNALEHSFPDPNNPMHLIDSNSEYGKKHIAKVYREYMLENYITSLKKKYKVNVYLTPPLSPRKNLSDIEKHFMGNDKAPTSIILVSAFDCPQCTHFHPIYQRLYEKYKDKVKFGQVHFSPEATLPILLSEYAHSLGKFWEMYNLIYENHPKDSIDYFQLAKQISFDSVQLVNYLSNNKIKQKIQTDFDVLMSEDILRTPSILINDRLYYGKFSFEKISKYLDSELKKNK